MPCGQCPPLPPHTHQKEGQRARPPRGPHLEPAPALALVRTEAAPATFQDASGLLLISCRAFLPPGPGSTSLHKLP